MEAGLREITQRAWSMGIEARKAGKGFRIADCGLRIWDLKRHGAWSMEHGEIKLAAGSWKNSEVRDQMSEVRRQTTEDRRQTTELGIANFGLWIWDVR